ncbi:MAG: hypothetical protein IT382_18855 [Deltaproteobacteria bacterium]|nr:hypothetical protein [Deltaproteobacteria bacterium]
MKPDTPISALKALVQSANWRRTDRTAATARSIEQSMRLEGIPVSLGAVLAAIRRGDTSAVPGR